MAGMGLGLRLVGRRRRRGFSDPNLAFTKFLAGFNGADGATTFLDESPAAHTGDFGVAEGASISTAQAKFGASSLLFEGAPATEALSVADHADWFFGAGPWTAEAWVRPTAITLARFILGQTDNLSNITGSSWGLWAYDGVPRLTFYNTLTANGQDVVGVSVLALNTWAHIAVDWDGAKIRLYVNGVMEGSVAYAGQFRDVSKALMIGNTFIRSAVFAGHVDEARVLKGKAAWANDAGFAVPVAPYARA